MMRLSLGRNADQVGTRAYITGLDGLRAFAAMMVFAFHAWGHSGKPDLPFQIKGMELKLADAFNFGASGVTLFFVLSGFLLSQTFWSQLRDGTEIDLREYFVRRFLRIYPAYFVVVVICGLFYDTAHPPLARLVQVVSHLLLIHNLSEVTVLNISAPLWSVATEFQLYLLLPPFATATWAIAKRGISENRAVIGMVLLGGIGASAIYRLAMLGVGWFSFDPRLVRADGFVVAASPFVRFAEFSVGLGFGYLFVLLKKSRSGLIRTDSPLWSAVEFVVILALAARAILPLALPAMPPAGWPTTPLLFGAFIFLAGYSRSRLRVGALLENRVLRALGRISYSFYLFHDLVLWNVYNRLPDRFALPGLSPNLTAALLAFILTVAVAAASYYLIERKVTTALSRPVRRLAGVDTRPPSQHGHHGATDFPRPCTNDRA